MPHHNQFYHKSLNQSAPTSDAAPPSAGSITFQVHALLELEKRLDERIEALRSLADFLVGSAPTGETKANLKSVGSGLIADFGDRVEAFDMQINTICYEFGRLERAIRGIL